VNKTIKFSVWTVLIAAVVGGIAAPKVMPLIQSQMKAKQTAKSDATGAKEGGKKKASGDAAIKVSTYIVRAAPFAETINSTGTLRADEGVELQAETNGKIVAINFTEGRQVHKGDLLLKLNDADLRANLERTTYSKELAKLKEKRYSQLLAQRVVTQNDYDAALSDVNVEQANIELYQAQIEKTEIRAPFDGVVGLRYVSMGAYVNAATRIATLQRVDKLKIDFSIPEKYVGRIKVGSPVTFNIAGGDRKFTGEIYAIDPRIDSATRTLVLRAECSNADGRLLPGAFANVELSLEQIKDALLIPSEAVVPGLDEKNVFVIKNGKAERRPVQTGTRTSSTIHVLAGLTPGDVVITSGLQQMSPGLAVLAIDGETPAADEVKGETKVEKKAQPSKKKLAGSNLAETTSTLAAQRGADRS
jgi:membrane fusion protein (multidrug efflux system)